MTSAASQQSLANASMQILSAQLYLADDPDLEPVVRALNDVRAELGRPRLHVIEGGGAPQRAPETTTAPGDLLDLSGGGHTLAVVKNLHESNR